MTELTLTEREQRTLRSLLLEEPAPGSPIPSNDVLDLVSRLVPCDAMGVAVATNTGTVVETVEVPGDFYARRGYGSDDEGGPLRLGITHWSRVPLLAEACGTLPGFLSDGLAVGCRSGADEVAQIWLDRVDRMFSPRDLAMVELLWPVLQRHLRVKRTVQLPARLTVQERRVLMQVAVGQTDREVAATLFIAPATVRKHLENSYRKLGVTNRVAAVVALRGDAPLDAEMAGRVRRAD